MTSAALALNRFGLGAQPQDAPPAQPQRWLLDQFERYAPRPAVWAGLPRTGAQLAQFQMQQQTARAAPEAAREVMQKENRREARDDYIAGVAARATSALETPAPFVERLVHFWANHFAISVDKVVVINLAAAFERDAIRPHVLGRFEDLLLAVVRHPAMLLYLDQAQSIGPNSPVGSRLAQRNPERARGLNENLAREILELHTLGVRSGYSQQDVTEFARALTGWSVEGPGPGGGGMLAQLAARLPGEARDGDTADGFRFRAVLHEPGSRTVLGKGYPQAGEAQALAVLRDLAAAPATARHIATKLARHFVADEPPPAVVQRLADAFMRSGGHLPTVYRALVESPEAWSGAAPKFKTPWEWAVSSLRALGRREVRGLQMVGVMNQLGQPVWRPGSPAGYDDVAATWAAPDALLRRVELAQRLASGFGEAVDARALAPRLLPGALSEATATAIARAESPASGLALLLVSPEFLRR